MKLNQYRRPQQSGFIVIIIAIIVVALAASFIFYIARVLSQLKLGGSNTNSTSFYYQTNYGGYTPLQVNYQSPTNGSGQSPTFTFGYGICSSNWQGWMSLTNTIATPAGSGNELENDSNIYAISVNLGTYSVYLKYDAQTGNQLSEVSNAAVIAVIQKSTNLVNWTSIYTDSNCLPDNVAVFTDGNAVESAASYRVKYLMGK